MTFLTQAHDRLLAGLAKAKPAEISMFPRASEMETRKDHSEIVASLVDDYFHSLAVDAASNSDAVKPAEWVGVVSTALSDQSLTGQFTDAAERLREDETAPRSDFDEHNVLNHAQQGIAR